MTAKGHRQHRHTLDHDGREITLVPLANHPEPARLLRTDFEALAETGITGQWTLNLNGTRTHGYVRCPASEATGCLVTVARLITRVGAGRTVRYRDRNPLNLRSDNLYLDRGRAKGRELALLAEAAELGSAF